MTILNAVIQGIMLGGFYALLACGLSLIFGVMRIINLAHGDLAVIGAFLAWAFVQYLGLPPLLALPPVLVIMFALGYALQRGMLERSLRAGVLIPLLTTFGLAIVIQNVLLSVFTADVRSLGGSAGMLTTTSWAVSDQISVSLLGIVILAVAVLVLGGLHVFLSRAPLGRAMRATAEDADTAELCGVNSRSVYARASGIAIGTAALAGIFLAIRSSVEPSSGPTQLVFAFEAVVIGGFGSLWGTLGGGIALGVAQTIGAQIDPHYSILAGHLVFLAVLIARSAGVVVKREVTA
jgi:branched-chain amino acid transport system permease protein